MADIVNTVLVKDSRISQISDKINYGVYKGAAQISQQTYQAQTATPSQSVWAIQVPSQNTMIDKRLLYRAKARIEIPYQTRAGQAFAAGGAAVNFPNAGAQSLAAVGYGKNCSLAAFPLHQMMNVVTATINSTGVTVNMADVLPFMLKMLNNRELRAYNSYAPTAVDIYGKYSDQVGANNSTFASFGESADQDIVGNGAWVIESAQFYDTLGNALTSASTVAQNTTIWLRIDFVSTEPLMVSPFTFAHLPFNNGALYGITALNFNITKQANGNRVWRADDLGLPAFGANGSAGGGFLPDPTQNVRVLQLQQSQEELLLTYMIGHPTDLLPQQNISNYYELPRFVNSLSTTSTISTGTTASNLSSQSLQFNYVPDMVMIGVVKRNKTFCDPDAFLPITRISVNFNSVVGILSSTQLQTLFEMSKNAGYSGSYSEFIGNAWSQSASVNKPVQTCGGFLALKFGRDINLPDDYMAPGLLGNFVFQFTYDVKNPSNGDINPADYQLVVIPMNSGVFVTNAGVSITYTAILSKEKVLQTSESNVYSEGDVQRLIGGSFWGTLKNIASSVKDVAMPLASIAKPILASMPNPQAQAASGVLGALGAGTSGGRKARDMRL